MGRALATILTRLAGTTTATALLALVGRTLATAILARLTLVVRGTARGLGGSPSAISGATARDLDLAIRNLIGHGRHRGLLLRARGMAATRTRRTLLLATRLATLVGRCIGTRTALGSGAGLAS